MFEFVGKTGRGAGQDLDAVSDEPGHGMISTTDHFSYSLFKFKHDHYTDANVAYGKRAAFVNEQEERDESSLTDGLTDPSDDQSCPSLSSTADSILTLDLGDTYTITSIFLHLKGKSLFN